MVFSSYVFIFFFLPSALLAYYISPPKIRNYTLTLFSYVFYGWANPIFMLLMFGSTVLDYTSGLVVSQQWDFSKPIEPLSKGTTRNRFQKIAVTVTIISNLSLLGFFKYFNFTLQNYITVMSLMGIDVSHVQGFFRIVLPLGLSFYTFHSMSYAIDVYRGDAKAIRNFIDYACYISMFPQLVAGPIIRFQEISDQLVFRTLTMEKFARGVAFFSLGLGKKVLLANPCGKIADMVFNTGVIHWLTAWYGVLAYAFQIYFDFSGYSDMAIGLGLMLGFVFAKNFDSPYHSQSITEFWRRWHLSLSFWLRDYLYIPLGGNRKGNIRTYVNLFLVMFLGGLWHGASWNFAVWGSIHGGMLGLERLQGKNSYYRWMPAPARVFLTFIILLITWVFFRAGSLSVALKYLKSMFGAITPSMNSYLINVIIYNPYYITCLLMAGIITWTCPQTWDFTKKLNGWKFVYIVGIFLLSVALLTTQSYNPFIYFIF